VKSRGSISPPHDPVIVGKIVRLLAKLGTAEKWVPAFPTELVRGLKAHGTTTGGLRIPVGR
jgi:hypothetical protein